jgi:hypothetical protein
MAENYIQLPVDGTGKKTRTISATIGGQEVHQQVVKVADGSDTVINPATENTLQGVSNKLLGTSLVAGRKTITTAGTAEQLGSGALLVGVVIQALKTNTGSVYVGTSTVDKDTNKQYELEPGESISISIDNLNKIYLDVDVSGEGVQFIGS